jgi:purine-cytosine permease-like protein
MKLEKFIRAVNIPYYIANHVIGEHHTPVHRKVAGIFIMIVGVGMAHMAEHLSNVLISLFGDLVGYSIHGTGLIPFLHDLEAAGKKQPEQKQNCETCLN